MDTVLTFVQHPQDQPQIKVHVDANWAGCSKSRRSTTGYVIYFQDNVVHSASKTQNSVALSSAESELYGVCSGVTEAIHLRNVLIESGLLQNIKMKS